MFHILKTNLNIFFPTTDGIFPLRVSPSERVGHIKDVLSSFTQIPSYCYELKFNSRFLTNDEVINELNITEDSLIDCIELPLEEANAKKEAEEKEIQEKQEKIRAQEIFMEKVDSIVKMGYNKKEAISALKRSKENVKSALKYLSSSQKSKSSKKSENKYKSDDDDSENEQKEDNKEEKEQYSYRDKKAYDIKPKHTGNQYKSYTVEEDKQILDFVRNQLANNLPLSFKTLQIENRTYKSISSRFNSKLKVYTNNFSDPDSIPKSLFQEVLSLTNGNTEQIKVYFPNLSDKDINYKKSHLNQIKWTKQTDDLIKATHHVFGDDWASMSKRLNINATPEQIRERFNYLQRLENNDVIVIDDDDDQEEEDN